MLILLCIITTIIQGSSLSSVLSRDAIMIGSVIPIIFVWIAVLATYMSGKDKLTEEKMVFAIIFSAMLLHCCYVLLTGIHDRQHDEGYYTGIATKQINPGHLGYAEYIYKFHKLPNMNPYQLFSYYHPPLHFVISAIWLIVLTSLGMPEELAFENLQILPLFYSGLLMLLTYLILKKIGSRSRGLYTGLFLVAMHPSLIIMSGSINNDMLSILLLACCILSSLCFIRDKSLKNLMLTALSIGFGMLCKVNMAAIALPLGLVFLMDLVNVVRAGDKHVIVSRIKNYILFGVTSAVIGLSWIVHNLVSFHEKPGVPAPGLDSVMYTGDYGIWARAGLPSFSDWHFEFPFHPLSGDAIHNIWVIMFQTSLFAEEYPANLNGIPFIMCQTAYVLSIILAIASAVLFIFTQYKKYKSQVWEDKLDAVFILVGYLTFMIGFVAFSFKYPYTCSSDFRYVVICLVYIAIGLAESDRIYPDKKAYAVISGIIRAGVCATLILTTIIYMTWKQW